MSEGLRYQFGSPAALDCGDEQRDSTLPTFIGAADIPAGRRYERKRLGTILQDGDHGRDGERQCRVGTRIEPRDDSVGEIVTKSEIMHAGWPQMVVTEANPTSE